MTTLPCSPTRPNSSFAGQESRGPAPEGQAETERKEGLVQKWDAVGERVGAYTGL